MERGWIRLLRLFAAAMLVAPAFAFAGAGITYHGRLVKPDGTPVTANPVKFKIELRSPGSENCLMYSETHAVDMSASDGIFAITVNDGTATVVNTEPFSLDRVFQNRGTFSFAGGKCALGSTYVPQATDGRKISVEFDDGATGGWEPLPAQSINFVPMSLEALTLNGYGSGSMLRVHDGTGAPASISALTQTQYNNLLDVLAGTSAMYATPSSSISGTAAGFTGSLAGDVTGTQGATAVVKLRGRDIDTTPPANGQVLKWNSTSNRWEPSADNSGASGTVMSVSGNGAISVTGTAADPIVNVQDASTSAKGAVQLATDGQNAANVAVQGNDSRLSNARAPTAHTHVVDEIISAAGKYLTYKPNNVQCADGQVLKWINANQRWECATDAGAAGTVASLTVNAPIVKTGTSSDPVLSMNDASLVQKGAVQLASSADSSAGLVVQANDTRLADARAPTAHTHVVDEIISAASKYFAYKPNNTACADNEILKWDNSNSRWVCSSVGALVNSESTTASNVGTAGVGVFKQLSTFDLQFKKLNAASSALSLTDDTANGKVDIGVNAELQGLSGLSANGFVKRTGAGAYSPISSIGPSDLNNAGSMAVNSGLLVRDGSQFYNKSCSGNEVLIWTVANGWSCNSVVLSESDPKVGANTTNYLSKWSGSALVASGIFESGGTVGIGTATTSALVHAYGSANTGVVSLVENGNNGTSARSYFEARNDAGNQLRMGILSSGNNTGGSVLPAQSTYFYTNSSSGLALVSNHASGTMRFATANTERMTIDAAGKVGIGSTTPAVSLDLGGKTDALALPKGTAAQQPSSPSAGWIRYNTDSSSVEVFNGSAWGSVSSGGTAVSPPGMVSAFPTASCPSGWLEANGSAVSRTTYASVFAAIGTIYGAGDGSTTFNLPDYRGYFLRGWNHGTGNDPDAASRTNRGDGTGGDVVGTKQAYEVQSHTHGISPGDAIVQNGSGGGYRALGMNTIQSAATGGNETRPKNINVIYCVSTATAPATTVASSGSGTTNTIPVWSSSTGLGNSPVAVSAGNVGIGTTSPATTLDVNGTMRLAKNPAAPYACDAGHDGALAMTNLYTTCACKNGMGWVSTIDGATSCNWNTLTIVTNASSRNWSDGSYATSCNGYRNPGAGKTYAGSTGDGIYTISISGTPTQVYCDMTNDGGGWTLVMRGHAGQYAASCAGWTGTGTYYYSGGATDATDGTAAGPTFKFSDAIINTIGGIYRVKTTGTYTATRFHKATCTYAHTTGASGDCLNSCSDAAATTCDTGQSASGYSFGLAGGMGTAGHGYGENYYTTLRHSSYWSSNYCWGTNTSSGGNNATADHSTVNANFMVWRK